MVFLRPLLFVGKGRKEAVVLGENKYGWYF